MPLDLIDPPLLGRRGFERHIVDKAPRVINDDVVCLTQSLSVASIRSLCTNHGIEKITFNTQGSSQWDSFRHFAYQKEGKFYNKYDMARFLLQDH